MSDRPRNHPDDETVAKWVSELPEVAADADFRDRLRSAFVSGEIDSAPADTMATAPSAAAPATPARPARKRTVSPRRRWWAWATPPLATAAVVMVLFAMNRGPTLELLEATGTGTVVIDGRSMAMDDFAAIGGAIRPGAAIEVPAGASIDLGVSGTTLYELAGGTRMTLPASPGRWFHRAVSCTMAVGELRLKTGPRFPGSELRVFTPEGEAVVTGTLLSVQCDDGGTCVCVLEGTAHVGVDDADLQSVSPGYRKIMLRDGTRDIIPIKDMHRDGVLDFDNRMGDRME
jgi:ferric-dicitrate binding protein FerR (iron transport regulator)